MTPIHHVRGPFVRLAGQGDESVQAAQKAQTGFMGLESCSIVGVAALLQPCYIVVFSGASGQPGIVPLVMWFISEPDAENKRRCILGWAQPIPSLPV